DVFVLNDHWVYNEKRTLRCQNRIGRCRGNGDRELAPADATLASRKLQLRRSNPRSKSNPLGAQDFCLLKSQAFHHGLVYCTRVRFTGKPSSLKQDTGVSAAYVTKLIDNWLSFYSSAAGAPATQAPLTATTQAHAAAFGDAIGNAITAVAAGFTQ